MKTLLMLFILLGGFGHLADKSSKQEDQKEEPNISRQIKNDKLDLAVVQSIKDYYQAKFGKGARLEETSNDTIINLTYYNIPNEDDESARFLIGITIPLIKNQELYGAVPILEGDLNKDRKNDLVISVHTEGGGDGANVWWQDIFIFIYKNKKYKLIDIKSDPEVCGCRSGGYFRARKIENNFIVGESSCYAEEDPRCCPSLYYETKVGFINNMLKYVSKKKKK